MNESQIVTLGLMTAAFIVFFIIVSILDSKSINGIKSKRIGDGQHGTARWRQSMKYGGLFPLRCSSLKCGGRARICRLFRVQ